MQIYLRLCVGALLLNLAACANELDQTSIEGPTRDARGSEDQLGDGRLDSELPSAQSLSDGHCIVRPGAGRFAVCGSLSGVPAASIQGTAIVGSSLGLGTVRSETHTLGGEIRAN